MRRSSPISANACSRLFVLCVLAIFSLWAAPSLHAQGWVEVERAPDRELPVGNVSRTGSDVRIAVDGRVARMEIEERFRNNGAVVAEGSYLYPMPGEAVFTNFSLWMGDQEVKGETMNAEQARSIYEEIVRRRKDPALLTFAGHGLVRARVFPIQAGETRKVALRYTQLLTRAGDALRLRYSLGTRGASGGSSLVVTASNPSSYGTPYSPTHAIQARTSGDRLEITFRGDATGEVELFLPLRQGLVGTSLVTHAPGGEDGYFMLLLAPGESEAGATLPRDLTLVVDVSGSMSGTKLEQAKAALEQAIGTLASGDRFRLIAFSSAVRRFRPDFVPATRANLTDAREFIAALGADGGTNIAGALDAALDAGGDAERLGIILFLTDGIPSVGELAPDRIAEHAAARIGRARIFSIGIGHDVNTYLLDRLASRGRGTAEYVPPGASVETATSLLMGKLRHPALVDLRIGDTPVSISQVFPTQLPDLFFGEELVVLGRYRGTGRGDVVVTGRRNGRQERISTSAVFPSHQADNEFIPKLWAARQIGELTRQIRLEGASPALVSQVRDLGLRFGILTEYTSYLVLEPPEAVAVNGVPMPARAEDAGGALNATAQTGGVAFERARASSKFSESKSLADADTLAATQLATLSPNSAAAPTTRRSGGRIFVMRGQVWTDIGHTDRITVTEVEAYSRAYFDLVRQLPELAAYLPVGDQLLIAGKRASIRVAINGVQAWKPGQLADLVRNFRGT